MLVKKTFADVHKLQNKILAMSLSATISNVCKFISNCQCITNIINNNCIFLLLHFMLIHGWQRQCLYDAIIENWFEWLVYAKILNWKCVKIKYFCCEY